MFCVILCACIESKEAGYSYKKQNVIIGMGLAAPVLLACVWVMILRFCTKVIVWGTLIILELGFLAAGLLCLIQVGVIDISAISAEAAAQYAAAASAVDTTSYDQYMTIFGYVFLILALIILLQMIFNVGYECGFSCAFDWFWYDFDKVLI